MMVRGIFFLFFTLISPALLLGQAQSPSADSVSSDDISIADGLQLPTFGHVWVLDTWKGVKELVQLHSAEDAGPALDLALKIRHTVQIKGEAASVRIHETAPQFFMRGVSGDATGEMRADFVILRLSARGNSRVAAKEASEAVSARGEKKGLQSRDVIELTARRIGSTDWYRLHAKQSLDQGEYVMVPWPGTPSAALNEMYDFAVDRDAPENRQPIRSEADRGPGS